MSSIGDRIPIWTAAGAYQWLTVRRSRVPAKWQVNFHGLSGVSTQFSACGKMVRVSQAGIANAKVANWQNGKFAACMSNEGRQIDCLPRASSLIAIDCLVRREIF